MEPTTKRRRALVVAATASAACLAAPTWAAICAPVAVGALAAAVRHHVRGRRKPLALPPVDEADTYSAAKAAEGIALSPPAAAAVSQPCSPKLVSGEREAHSPLTPSTVTPLRRCEDRATAALSELLSPHSVSVARGLMSPAEPPPTTPLVLPEDGDAQWSRTPDAPQLAVGTPSPPPSDRGSAAASASLGPDAEERRHSRWRRGTISQIDLVETDEAHDPEVKFKPGRLGMVIMLATGRVSEVKDGQALALGVQAGWTCITVDGQPYSEDLLKAKIEGPSSYKVVFSRTTPMEHSPARPKRRIGLVGSASGESCAAAVEGELPPACTGVESLASRPERRASATPSGSPKPKGAKAKALSKLRQEGPCAVKRRCQPPHELIGCRVHPGPCCDSCWRSLCDVEKAQLRRRELLSNLAPAPKRRRILAAGGGA